MENVPIPLPEGMSFEHLTILMLFTNHKGTILGTLAQCPVLNAVVHRFNRVDVSHRDTTRIGTMLTQCPDTRCE